jgi:hypothetical protein
VETYRYVNIFETKGLEYLLLISFLVLFIFLVRYLMREPNESESPPKTPWHRRPGRQAGD